MAEPTSALTYSDLVLAVAEQLGLAYYGPLGTLAAAVPTDAYELDRCTRFCNDGIRMFIADAPPNGWRWQRPLAQVQVWPDIGFAMPPQGSGPTVTAATLTPSTITVTASVDSFTASQIASVLAVRGKGLYTILTWTSAKVITCTGLPWSGSSTFMVQAPAGKPTLTITAGSNVSTITGASGTFFESTRGKTLYVTDLPAITLTTYSSDTSMIITDVGNTIATAWGAGARTFSLSANGQYSLPQTFGGEYDGPITYAAGSNRGVPINWTSEVEIRRLRENWNSVTGNPYYASIRRSQTNRQWELLIYPNTGGFYTFEFPYTVYFDKIDPATITTTVHPAGIQHDETVKAACLAAAEMQAEDSSGTRVQYYRSIALPNAMKTDTRSAPRRLGYCGNPAAQRAALREFRDYLRRPTVTYSGS